MVTAYLSSNGQQVQQRRSKGSGVKKRQGGAGAEGRPIPRMPGGLVLMHVRIDPYERRTNMILALKIFLFLRLRPLGMKKRWGGWLLPLLSSPASSIQGVHCCFCLLCDFVSNPQEHKAQSLQFLPANIAVHSEHDSFKSQHRITHFSN